MRPFWGLSQRAYNISRFPSFFRTSVNLVSHLSYQLAIQSITHFPSSLTSHVPQHRVAIDNSHESGVAPLGLVAYSLPNLIITSYIADFIAANAKLAALNYHTLVRRVEIRGASQRNVTIVLCLDFRGGKFNMYDSGTFSMFPTDVSSALTGERS